MAFNLLAQVGTPDVSGHLPLERRLVEELRELLALPSLKVSATCIQVPVFFGDSFTVALRTAGAVDVAAVNAALESADGVELVDAGITLRRWAMRWAGRGLCGTRQDGNRRFRAAQSVADLG